MKGRVAFVTGASQGIGRACALELAAAGARVVVGARRMDKLEELVEQIRSKGGEAEAVQLDIASKQSIQEAFDQARGRCGDINILVNNAGITHDALAVRMSMESWTKVLETNLTGSFLAVQAVLLGMMRARWGRIINISSVVGEAGNAGQANYAASKAGLIGMTKALAQEVASRHVTVNAVAPGFIESAMTDAIDEKVRQKILSVVPLRRMGLPAEVAYAVRFLASDEADYITGHVLNINGGMYM